jgi:hypothetical protein
VTVAVRLLAKNEPAKRRPERLVDATNKHKDTEPKQAAGAMLVYSEGQAFAVPDELIKN